MFKFFYLGSSELSAACGVLWGLLLVLLAKKLGVYDVTKHYHVTEHKVKYYDSMRRYSYDE